MELNLLDKAIDDEKNERLFTLTTKKIKQINFNILKELQLDENITIDYFNKLKNYRYIDEISELKYGAFIRWIPITNPDYLPLHFCGIICDIKFTDNGTYILCKNFMHRHYQLKMDECLIFQKLTTQELILLSALDHLANENNENNDIENSEDEDEENDN
jgi:hypothetical protein